MTCATRAATIPAPYELATWRGFRTSAVSYTFDDNSPKQFSVAQPMFDARGLHATFFCIVGSLSSAPNTKPPAELVPDPAAARKQLKLLYLSCGNKDGLINISQGVHRYLKEKNVPHIWNVDDQPHDRGTWANNLFHFAQLLFR